MLANELSKDTSLFSTRAKAQTWSKNDGDRFIPRRASMNNTDFSLLSKELDSDSEGTRSESSSFSQILKQSLSELETAASKKKFFRYKTNEEAKTTTGGFEDNSKTSSKRTLRKRFVLPEKPFKILEAPDISDDFYHNIFDWSPSNVLGVSLGNSVYLLNTDSSKVSKLYEAFECETISSIQWNETGDHLAIGNVLGQISIWDVNARKEVVSLDTHENRVCTLDWRSTLISGSKDTTIVQHDLRQKIPQVTTFVSHTQEVCKVKWSPDEQYFCSGGNDNKVFIWTSASPMPIMKESHQACVKALAWSEKQYGVLASGGGASDRMIKTWNVRTRELMHERLTDSQVCSLVFSRHTNDLISSHGYPYNEVTLWRTNGLKKIGSLFGHTERVLYLNLSPCGNTLVSGSSDETLRFWKLYDGSLGGDSVTPGQCFESSNIR